MTGVAGVAVTWIERSAQWSRENQVKFMGGATQAVLQAIADHNAAKEQASDGTGFALPGSASSAVPARDEEKASG